MRRLLISAAALAFFIAPALAQPNPNRVGKAAAAPEVQDRAQAELRRQAQQQQQAQPQQPGGGQPGRGNRDTLSAAPADRSDGNRNERGNRGDRNNRNDNRRDRDGDRRNWNRRDDNRAFNRDFNRDGRTDYRRPGYGGPRHDFSGFRDFHRTFHASRRFRAPYYRRPAGWYDHRWIYGELLPTAFWARDYWLEDFAAYDLAPPPYGAVWVRVGDDALLVDEESGEIITVAYDVFY